MGGVLAVVGIRGNGQRAGQEGGADGQGRDCLVHDESFQVRMLGWTRGRWERLRIRRSGFSLTLFLILPSPHWQPARAADARRTNAAAPAPSGPDTAAAAG